MDIQQRYMRAIRLAALFGTLALAGCAIPASEGKGGRDGPGIAACTADCRLDVVLPPQSRRPELPPGQQRLRVRGNSDITIHNRGAGEVLLVFDMAAFADVDGKPLFTVKLAQGRNSFRTRPAGSCPPSGCKYTIVDLNNPNRPPLDPWIIIDPY